MARWDAQYPVTELQLADFPFGEWHQPPLLLENAKDGSLLVRVLAGPCLVGDPPLEVTLPSFLIALHLVTNGQYVRFVRETGHAAPDNGLWLNPRFQEHPVTGVSWPGAEAYCRWADLYLPGELEWEKAMRGNKARGWCCRDAWKEPEASARIFATASVWKTGEPPSPWGLCASGNVWEWCADWYEVNAWARWRRGELTPPGSGHYRVIRRRDRDQDRADLFRAPGTERFFRGFRNGPYGFRCAKRIAEP